MKSIFAFIIIITGIYFGTTLAPMLLPWWLGFAWAAIVCLLLNIRPMASFWTGFLALSVLWGGLAVFTHTQNDGLLGDSIGAVFQTNGWAMIALTAFLGGLLGGLSACCGSLFRQLFVKQSTSPMDEATA